MLNGFDQTSAILIEDVHPRRTAAFVPFVRHWQRDRLTISSFTESFQLRFRAPIITKPFGDPSYGAIEICFWLTSTRLGFPKRRLCFGGMVRARWRCFWFRFLTSFRPSGCTNAALG